MLSFNHRLFVLPNVNTIYWLGFIKADGNLYRTLSTGSVNHSYQLQINLADKDLQHLHQFRKHIEAPTTCIHPNHSTNSNILQVSWQKFDKYLLPFGIGVNKTTIEYPITHRLLAFQLFARYYLIGWFDGDGCICIIRDKRRPNSIRFDVSIAGNYHELIGYSAILQSVLGYPYPLEPYWNKYARCWYLRFSNQETIKAFINCLDPYSCNLKLKRKWEKLASIPFLS